MRCHSQSDNKRRSDRAYPYVAVALTGNVILFITLLNMIIFTYLRESSRIQPAALKTVLISGRQISADRVCRAGHLSGSHKNILPATPGYQLNSFRGDKKSKSLSSGLQGAFGIKNQNINIYFRSGLWK